MGDETTMKAHAAKSTEGEALWWAGALAVIKAGSAQTGGHMALIEVTEPPGAKAPLHVHHKEDEGFWVLDGSVTFEVGGTSLDAGPGDFAFGPRDVPHRYTVGPDGCRLLFILTPGGFEDLVRKMSEPAGSRTLPPADEPSASDEEPDMAEMMALTGQYGIEILDG